jgi:rhomboid protease GluP
MRVCIAENLTRSQVDAYSLVLSAYDHPHIMQPAPAGWQLWVDGELQFVCRYLIAQYDTENPPDPITFEAPKPNRPLDMSAVWVCLLLLACHMLHGQAADTHAVVRTYAADASAILHGQFYRAVSALMLHSGYPHLIANMAGLAVFATAVTRACGAGVGWLMVLASGVSGNLINAFFFERGHVSIGASTAVFGALGILAGHQFWRKWQTRGQRRKAWLPVAGALALLGFLGASAHSDVLAHLFGFFSGLPLGLIYTATQLQPPRQSIQRYAAVVAVAVVLLAWASPMVRSHSFPFFS